MGDLYALTQDCLGLPDAGLQSLRNVRSIGVRSATTLYSTVQSCGYLRSIAL